MYANGTGTRKPISITLLVASALILAAASPTLAGDTDLAGRAASWEKAYNAGMDEAIAALYTEDATRMPYQLPLFTGREAIIANLGEGRDQGLASIKLKVSQDEAHGDMAWGRGTYALMDADGNVVLAGKWMNVSKKVGDAWLIHADIWNTDEPDE